MITFLVNEVDIVMDKALLGKLLGVSKEGYCEYSTSWWAVRGDGMTPR